MNLATPPSDLCLDLLYAMRVTFVYIIRKDDSNIDHLDGLYSLLSQRAIQEPSYSVRGCAYVQEIISFVAGRSAGACSGVNPLLSLSN